MKILYRPDWKSQQRQHEKRDVCIYPVRMAMEAEHYRKKEHSVVWDKDVKGLKWDKIITKTEMLPMNWLPWPDREWTDAKNKKYQRNGNFKYLPGTYTLAASGCWWGKCKFCAEKDRSYYARPPLDVLKEIEHCMRFGFREIFDDSATFPDGKWLRDFCRLKKARMAYKIQISCNMRIGADVDFKLMKEAGFRMLLFGVESANQETLNKINKGVKVEQIVPTIKQASDAGLEPHVAVMFGYPWETDKDSQKTLDLVHHLLKKGYAKTAQASFYGCKGEKSRKESRAYVRKIYDVGFSPEFWWNKIKDIKSLDNIKYLIKQIKTGVKDKWLKK